MKSPKDRLETGAVSKQVEASSSHQPKQPSKRKVEGEEPTDEMRRKGLGEEPKLLVTSQRAFSGRKLCDLFGFGAVCRNGTPHQKA